ncbi:MAG: UDP-N-acetylglucosamine 2-epimerase (non-hydrolyzing) [Acidobacteriota bacterium]
MKILSVVAARPNFMKVAPVMRALGRLDAEQLLVHTGQHYDSNMSKVFFDELGLPEPDIYLGVGSGSHAQQTGAVMTALEGTLEEHRPDLVLVAGDVNSTLAAALVAAKASVPLGHIESGLRSFDRTMPEEVNRVVVDHLSDLLFTTEESAHRNLAQEGIIANKVHFVGNCMVDSLLHHRDRALASSPWERFELEPGGYGLLTLHRPSNVDDPADLRRMLATLGQIAERLPLLFPVHPRTRDRIEASGLSLPASLTLCEPLPYLAFLGLMARARYVLTDSGGIQEETTALDIPCLTLRWNTERPVTVDHGSNRLVGTDPTAIRQGFEEILAGNWPRARRPELWDGRAGERIASVIEQWATREHAETQVLPVTGR